MINTYFAIVNPCAGSGKTMANWHRARTVLEAAGVQWVEQKPDSTEDNYRLTLAACAEGYRWFMAVGGDGTVHTVMRALVDYCRAEGENLGNFRLAVVPIGSGNDFLRSHNLPKDYEVLAKLIVGESFAPQDVVQVDCLAEDQRTATHTYYMANIGGYNFDANVCAEVNRQKAEGKRGHLLYFRALMRLFAYQRVAHTRVVCDGETVVDEPIYTLSVGNGRYSGGGLMQTPSAVMNDGLVNLMVAPKFPLWKLPLLISKVFRGRTEEIRFLYFFTAREVYILPREGEKAELFEVDGENIGPAPLRIRVLEQQLPVLDGSKR